MRAVIAKIFAPMIEHGMPCLRRGRYLNSALQTLQFAGPRTREHTEVCCLSIDREIGSSGHEACEPVRGYKTIDCGSGRLEVAWTSTNATRRTGSSGTSTAVLRAPTSA